MNSNKLFFYKGFANIYPAYFFISKHFAEHWDLPNTEIFYFKDVASAVSIPPELLYMIFTILPATVMYSLYVHQFCMI
jgi:hypothetical protein